MSKCFFCQGSFTIKEPPFASSYCKEQVHEFHEECLRKNQPGDCSQCGVELYTGCEYPRALPGRDCGWKNVWLVTVTYNWGSVIDLSDVEGCVRETYATTRPFEKAYVFDWPDGKFSKVQDRLLRMQQGTDWKLSSLTKMTISADFLTRQIRLDGYVTPGADGTDFVKIVSHDDTYRCQNQLENMKRFLTKWDC